MIKKQKKFRAGEKGFTLIELMVVVVILGILATVVMPKLIGRTDKAKVTKAIVDMSAIKTGLKLYKLDNGNYPTTEQGIAALITKPETEPLPKDWSKGGYLDENHVPKDPWGVEYLYLSPGLHGDFDIISYGADRTEGGTDLNKDIKSWEIE
ncbi:MAG: type II secretion system major pseudopilin GspG [Desulfobacteraceae bacterium]|nr:type II secretion system major pseudopilin GspG [Desulfobacteraceae bacterium]